MDIRRIVLGTDFSEAAAAAADVALGLARALGAPLDVVHVVPPATDPVHAGRRLASEVAAFGDAVQAVLLHGRPGATLTRYAREQGVDLIVLGTHGRTGFSRAVLGSVAEQVVRLAPCLVLTVPGHRLTRKAPAEPAASAHHCVVCGSETEELMCATCRERIRAEALASKLDAERPARRGAPH